MYTNKVRKQICIPLQKLLFSESIQICLRTLYITPFTNFHRHNCQTDLIKLVWNGLISSKTMKVGNTKDADCGKL